MFFNVCCEFVPVGPFVVGVGLFGYAGVGCCKGEFKDDGYMV